LLGGHTGRSTAVRMTPTAGDHFVGVVAGSSIARFQVWQDAADVPDQVLVRVGTSARLRIHRLALA
jgi:hypothetical protein